MDSFPMLSLCASAPSEDVGDDLHIAMRMHWKTATRRDEIFIDHAQRSKARPLGVTILVERNVWRVLSQP